MFLLMGCFNLIDTAPYGACPDFRFSYTFPRMGESVLLLCNVSSTWNSRFVQEERAILSLREAECAFYANLTSRTPEALRQEFAGLPETPSPKDLDFGIVEFLEGRRSSTLMPVPFLLGLGTNPYSTYFAETLSISSFNLVPLYLRFDGHTDSYTLPPTYDRALLADLGTVPLFIVRGDYRPWADLPRAWEHPGPEIYTTDPFTPLSPMKATRMLGWLASKVKPEDQSWWKAPFLALGLKYPETGEAYLGVKDDIAFLVYYVDFREYQVSSDEDVVLLLADLDNATRNLSANFHRPVILIFGLTVDENSGWTEDRVMLVLTSLLDFFAFSESPVVGLVPLAFFENPMEPELGPGPFGTDPYSPGFLYDPDHLHEGPILSWFSPFRAEVDPTTGIHRAGNMRRPVALCLGDFCVDTINSGFAYTGLTYTLPNLIVFQPFFSMNFYEVLPEKRPLSTTPLTPLPTKELVFATRLAAARTSSDALALLTYLYAFGPFSMTDDISDAQVLFCKNGRPLDLNQVLDYYGNYYSGPDERCAVYAANWLRQAIRFQEKYRLDSSPRIRTCWEDQEDAPEIATRSQLLPHASEEACDSDETQVLYSPCRFGLSGMPYVKYGRGYYYSNEPIWRGMENFYGYEVCPFTFRGAMEIVSYLYFVGKMRAPSHILSVNEPFWRDVFPPSPEEGIPSFAALASSTYATLFLKNYLHEGSEGSALATTDEDFEEITSDTQDCIGGGGQLAPGRGFLDCFYGSFQARQNRRYLSIYNSLYSTVSSWATMGWGTGASCTGDFCLDDWPYFVDVGTSGQISKLQILFTINQ